MDQKKIDRINELAKKKKEQGLTEEELNEQAALRQEYLNSVRENFRKTLESIEIKDQSSENRTAYALSLKNFYSFKNDKPKEA